MGHQQIRKKTPTNKGKKNLQTREKHQQTREKKTPTNKKNLQTRENTSKQGEKNTKQEKKHQTRKTPFEQGVSSDQMQKLTNGRSFRSRQGVCERWRVDIVYWYGAMGRKPRGTGGGDGVGSAPLVVRLRSPLALV